MEKGPGKDLVCPARPRALSVVCCFKSLFADPFWCGFFFSPSIQVLTEEEGGTLYSATERMLPRHPFGAVDTSQLLHLLSQHGLLDARVEDTPRGVIIHLVPALLAFVLGALGS